MTAQRALILAGILFLAAWVLLHPALPWDPDADIYDHLSVARNLLRGDGLRGEVIYPLTTAFEWGCDLPQPMLHRPPGFVLLLAPVLGLTGFGPDDASGAATVVRWLQVGLLAGILGVGLAGLARRDAAGAGPAWLLLLLFNPLLALAVGWGWSELACALVLLVLWLRLRDRYEVSTTVRAALIDGALAGVLTLLRTELAWIPLAWWLAATCLGSRGPGGWTIAARCWLLPAATAWLAVTAPWWIHVWRVAGSPFFNPLSYALQLDLAERWWDYPRLRGLSPEAPLDNLRDNLPAALVKTRHGLRFFLTGLGQWLPWSAWGGGVVLGLLAWRRRAGRSASRRRSVRWLRAAGPGGLLALTLAGLMLVYAPLSQETRHLLVLLPVLAWEIALAATRLCRRLVVGAAWRAILPAVAASLAILLTPSRETAEWRLMDGIADRADRAEQLAAELAVRPAGPVFTDNAAVCWLSGRRGVWRPWDAAVETSIRARVPGMAHAPWVRLYETEREAPDNEPAS